MVGLRTHLRSNDRWTYCGIHLSRVVTARTMAATSCKRCLGLKRLRRRTLDVDDLLYAIRKPQPWIAANEAPWA